MPRSNHSFSPKKSLKHTGKQSGIRHQSPESTPSFEAMAQFSKSGPKSFNRSLGKSKGAALGGLNAHRKRKPSISSISSVSSVSVQEDSEDDEADSEASSDDDDADEEDQLAPSYGSKNRRGGKTGSKTGSSSRTKGKKKKRKLSYDDGYDGQQSGAEDSSDDGYGAVDDITDADDEELDVEKLEEQLIVESEDEHRKVHSIVSISDAADMDEWAGLGSFEDHIPFSTATFLDEEQLYSALDAFGETDMTSEAVETSVQRHVHFEEDDSDSSSDSDQDHSGSTDDEIPGDFLQQDSLDPTLRRMIENDHESLSRNQGYDDVFGEMDFNHPANIYHVESDAVSDGSSGYESDDGETTDEDLPPPATITHPRSILRRDSTASVPANGDVAGSRSVAPRRRGPIMGTFIADPSKPVALVDCTGKHLVIIPAYASSRHDWLESATNSLCGTASNSPRATMMHLVDDSDTDALASPTGPDLSPMLSSGANLMMTALGNDATPGGQVMGPPEAFYPSRTFTADSSYEDEDDDEDDDDEAMLNVDDFIDFGDGSSDDEEMEKAFEDEDLTTSPVVQGAGTPTPNRGANDSHQGSSAERFLNHLDKGIVTAFRRNHNRYQALIRLPQHREFMPANSPSRPASVFRHSRYADPRTPTRKRKPSNYAGGEAVRRKLLDAHRRGQLPF